MPSCFSSLKDKAGQPRIKKQGKQAKGRDMDIGGNSFFFQVLHLSGSTTGNEGKGWPVATDNITLLFKNVRGKKAKQTNTPGLAGKLFTGLFE